MTHLLDLPEITDLIASFLPNRALLRCIRVSKQWHCLFLPALWRIVSITTYDVETKSGFDFVPRHARLVWELSLKDSPDDLCARVLLWDMPSLHTLQISTRSLSCQTCSALADLIRRQGPILRSVTINPQPDFSTGLPLRNVFQILDGLIRNHGRLRTLCLGDVEIQVDSLSDTVKRFLGNLNSLAIDKVEFLQSATKSLAPGKKGLSPWPKSGEQPNSQMDLGMNTIQHLTIARCDEPWDEFSDEYGLVVDSQEIRSLKWVDARWRNNNARIAWEQDLQKGWWPYLNTLHLQHELLEDQDLASIILALGERPMKEMDFRYTGFGRLSTDTLLWRGDKDDKDLNQPRGKIDAKEKDLALSPSHLRLSLERLCLRNCSYVTGSMVQKLLCSFPNLKQFGARYLTDAALVADPRPWACTGLESLHLAFLLEKHLDYWTHDEDDEDDDDGTAAGLVSHNSNIRSRITERRTRTSLPNIFLDRLAALTRLELWYPLDVLQSDHVTNEHFESLSLRCDMKQEKLKGLTRMTRLGWDNSENILTLQEVQWIVKYWPSLETVNLSYHTSAIEDEAFKFMKEGSIFWTGPE